MRKAIVLAVLLSGCATNDGLRSHGDWDFSFNGVDVDVDKKKGAYVFGVEWPMDWLK